MALQALSQYGAVTYAKSGAASKVTLQSGGVFQQDFQVDATNRLLLQRVPLPQVPGEYSAEVSGEGCVYLQVRLTGAGGILGGQAGARERVHQMGGREGSGRGEGRRRLLRCVEVKEWARRRVGSAAWRSCANGRSGEAGCGEDHLPCVLSTLQPLSHELLALL